MLARGAGHLRALRGASFGRRDADEIEAPLDAFEVEIHFQGKPQGLARLVDPVINAGLPPVKRSTASEPEPTGINFVELLKRKKEDKE